MTFTDTPLNALAYEIREVNLRNGWNICGWSDWHDAYKVPAVLGLVGTEVSEAIEAFRNDDLMNFREEMADVLIRTLDCAAAFDPDIDDTVRRKIEKNRGRGYRHGGKRL